MSSAPALALRAPPQCRRLLATAATRAVARYPPATLALQPPSVAAPGRGSAISRIALIWRNVRANALASQPRGESTAALPTSPAALLTRSYSSSSEAHAFVEPSSPAAARMRRKRQALPKPGQSLAETHPEVAREWDKIANAKMNRRLTPSDISRGSRLRAVWKCHSCGHTWEAHVHARTRPDSPTGCPRCFFLRTGTSPLGVRPKPPKPGQSLAEAEPAVAAEWDADANGGLAASEVSRGSRVVAAWRCAADRRHRWEAAVYSRTGRGGSGCPECALERRAAPRDEAGEDLEASEGAEEEAGPGPGRRAKSAPLFWTHPRLAAEWHPSRNGALSAESVAPGSQLKVWWRCRQTVPVPAGGVAGGAAECGHEYRAGVRGRAGQGKGCPACAGVVVSWWNSLEARFPPVAAEWAPDLNRGALPPAQLLPSASVLLWWRCRRCAYEWRQSPLQRTQQGRGCPCCAAAAEAAAGARGERHEDGGERPGREVAYA
eukprot:tig00000802_g4300.t1